MDETAVLRRRQREVWPAPLCRLTSARALQTEAILREHTAQTRRAITVIRSPTAPSTALAHPQHWPIPSTHCVQATCRCPRVGAAGLFPGRAGLSRPPAPHSMTVVVQRKVKAVHIWNRNWRRFIYTRRLVAERDLHHAALEELVTSHLNELDELSAAHQVALTNVVTSHDQRLKAIGNWVAACSDGWLPAGEHTRCIPADLPD